MIFQIAVCALVIIVTFVLVFRLWWRFAPGAFVVHTFASAFFWFAYYDRYYKYKDWEQKEGQTPIFDFPPIFHKERSYSVESRNKA